MHKKMVIILSIVVGLVIAGISFEIWGPGFLPPLEEEGYVKEKTEKREVFLDRESLVAQCPFIPYVKKQILVYNDKLPKLANRMSENCEAFESGDISLKNFEENVKELNNEFDNILLEVKSLQASYRDRYPKDYLLYFGHLIESIELYLSATSEAIRLIEAESLSDLYRVTEMIKTANEKMKVVIDSTPKLP